MRRSRQLVMVSVLLSLAAARPAGADDGTSPSGKAWRGVHVMAPRREDVPVFKRAIKEGLQPLGVNVVILEVNSNFAYRSHPELGEASGLDHDQARELAAYAREHGIRLIPQYNCLGHQSWARVTGPLLRKYPQFDETPEVPADNKGIYCRSWCPLHPDVNPVVFTLIDELIDAFAADAFHVGMDEVFLIASNQCSRCRGKSPAEVFAKAVNDLHRHVVGEKHLEMLMWGDRLLDGKATGYGKWEASENGTAPAIDLIPKDIIVCDWHYEPMKSYPSVAIFQDKGFRVWPSSWHDTKAALAFLADARRVDKGKVIGHLGTTWTGAGEFSRALLEPASAGTGKTERRRRDGVEALRLCMKALDEPAVAGDPYPKGKWTSLFNGKDLEGWTPKITGSALGVNYLDTFRVEDGVLKVSYDKYSRFKGEFGHLFYKHPFSSYRLRVEYRFVGEQVKGGPGWAFRNSGAMIHGQPPETMRVDQDFPVSIEVQYLGGSGKGERPTGNLCTPGTHIVMGGKLVTQHCTESKSKTFDGDQWVTVEVEAHGYGKIKHFVNGELVLEYEQAQLDGSDPDALKLTAGRKGDRKLSGGYISLQAESHPIEFRKVEIMPLEE